jgi:hypothetical protein
MPRALRMPGPSVVPDRDRRAFVAELFRCYKAAGRPTLAEISDQIAEGDYRGTASRETIRRALAQGAVPSKWLTAEAIFLALCAMADFDPEEKCYHENDWNGEGDERTRLDWFREAWNVAFDADPSPPPSAPDPWAVRDEPPF